MLTGKLNLCLKLHGSELLMGDRPKCSLDIEAIVISGDRTVSGQPVEFSMNGKSHRLATMANGGLRSELIFPAGSGMIQKLEAVVPGNGSPSPLAACSIDVILPGRQNGGRTESKTQGPDHEAVLNGNLPVRRGEIVTIPTGFYDVTGDVHIQRGGKVIVSPGCTLEFSESAGIRCEGVLEAVGTAAERITFTALRAHWGNILIYGRHADGTRMEHCLVEHGSGRCLEQDAERGVMLPENCREDAANTQRHGGGLQLLYTHKARLMFLHLLVRENATGSGCGGGIYIHGSAPVFRDCDIIENNAAIDGGGIYIAGTGTEEARITKLEIHNNRCLNDGGGIYLDGIAPYIENSSITQNEARFGGGVYHNDLDPKALNIDNCRIEENLSLAAPDDNDGISGTWPD